MWFKSCFETCLAKCDKMASAERIGFVQTLRKVAKECGVPLIPDNAARSRVKVFAEAIASSGGPAQRKREAATAYQAYEDTFKKPDEAEAAEEGQESDDEVGKVTLSIHRAAG